MRRFDSGVGYKGNNALQLKTYFKKAITWANLHKQGAIH